MTGAERPGTIRVRLHGETARRVQALAAAAGMSPTRYLHRLIENVPPPRPPHSRQTSTKEHAPDEAR